MKGLGRVGVAVGVLALVASARPAAAQALCKGALFGDITRDGVVNVVDVQCGVLTTLSTLLGPAEWPLPECLGGTPEEVDLNCVPPFDIIDVQLAVQAVLGTPLSVALDSNGSGCPDKCEDSACGNGLLEPGEECDDGNTVAGDGCSPECTLEGGLLAMISPAWVPETTCFASADCSAQGVCLQSQCVRGWGIQSVRSLEVEAVGLPFQGQTVRVCGGVAAPGEATCVAGAKVLAQAPLTAGTATVPLSNLPEGTYLLTAEVQTAAGASTWVNTLANPTPAFRRRVVTIDLTPPAIEALTATSDVLEPFGVLSAAEQVGPRTFEFEVAVSEPAKVSFFAEASTKAVAPTGEDHVASAAVGFASEGAKLIQARAVDLVGNESGLASLPITVDTVPPPVAILYPDQSPVRQFDSRDIVVQTEAGAEVQLFDGAAPLASAIAPAGGLVVFSSILEDGLVTLRAVAVDAAGNVSEIGTEPAQILVSTTPPEVTLLAPASGTLTPNGDVSPEPGYQVEVQLASPAAASWKVRIAGGCDAEYTACGPPVIVASGAGAAPLAVTTVVTLPASATPHYRLEAVVADDVGNTAADAAELTLVGSPCALSVTGLPASGFVNASACAQAPCDEVTLSLATSVASACGPTTSARLLIGGEQAATQPLVGGATTFAAPLSHGAQTTLEVQALGASGQVVVSSGPLPVVVDLLPPQVEFVAATVGGFATPASGDEVAWGVAASLGGGGEHFRGHLRLVASDDGASGAMGQLVEVSLVPVGGAPAPLPGAQAPQAIAAWPWTRNLLNVELPHGFEGLVVATVRDGAGNQASASFQALVDVVPPAPPALMPIDAADVNPRLPSVALRWPAVGSDGDGGGPAAQYEVRYRRGPIESEEEFDGACRVEDVIGSGPVPPPGEPGQLESYLLTGPDPRSPWSPAGLAGCKLGPSTTLGETYTFAVRAVDAVGNRSALTTASVRTTGELALRYATVYPMLDVPNPSNLSRRVFAIGDVNADGYDDLAVGGRDSHGFCVIFGGPVAGGGPPDLAELVLDTMQGPSHQCFFDEEETGLGSPLVALGDVDGDGIADFGAGAGGFGAPDAAEELRVWRGVAGGPLAAEPALVIRGSQNGIAFGLPVAGRGNFNCDTAVTGAPLMDIAIGSRLENRTYVVPGRASWPAPVLDLSSAEDRQLFQVVTIEMTDAPADAAFGFRVHFAGDVLGGNGLGCDELMITQSKGNGQVVLLRGRPTFFAPATIRLTQASTGAEPGDATALRLLQEAVNPKSAFGAGLAAGDFDGDGFVDVMVNHPTNARLHHFRGAALQNKLGQIVRVFASGAAQHDGVLAGTNGWIYQGAFDGVAAAGNFDDDALVPGGTVDLVYGNFDLFVQSYGQAFVRLNAGLAADGTGLGLLPFEDVVIEEPIATGTPESFATTVVPAGDFDGDGRPDLFIGTASGYATIVY